MATTSKQVGDVAKVEAAESPKLRPLIYNRDYMLLWSGQVVSTMGNGVSFLALPLLILAITNSPFATGIASALYSLPYLLFSLPVGALMDRWDRKWVMIVADVVRAVNIATIPFAMFFGVLTVWQLCVTSFIEGTAFVFFNLAETAALPRVVDKRQLPAAVAQNEAAMGVVGLLGPSLGGFLYQSVGRIFPFIFDTISYAASVISLFFVGTSFQGERKAAQQHNLGAEIKEGLRWMWTHKLIRDLALIVSGINFFFASTYLIVILLVQQRFGASPAEIGLIITIGSVGAIGGSVIGGTIQRRFSFGAVVAGGMWVEAIFFPLVLFAPNIFVVGLINLVMTMAIPVFNIVQGSYRMALIPDHLQGRVTSAVRLIAWGTPPLGAALSGLLLQQFGTTVAIVGFSCVPLVCAISATLNPHIRNARPLAEIAAENKP